jgi:hypothetical protein
MSLPTTTPARGLPDAPCAGLRRRVRTGYRDEALGQASHPFASREGLTLIVALLIHQGGMCPKCGKGTRATSKRWARCIKCGNRVERKLLKQYEAECRKHCDKVNP